MPSSTPERQSKWKDDFTAMSFLQKRGLALDKTWHWVSEDDRTLTDEEADAVLYLIEEWDFGGYIHKSEGMGPYHPKIA